MRSFVLIGFLSLAFAAGCASSGASRPWWLGSSRLEMEGPKALKEEPTEELVSLGRVQSGHTWARVRSALRVGQAFRVGEEAWGEGRIAEVSDSVIVVTGGRRLGHGGIALLTCELNPAAVAVGARIVPYKGQAVVNGFLALYGGEGCELGKSKGLDIIGLFTSEVAMGVTRVLGEPGDALLLR